MFKKVWKKVFVFINTDVVFVGIVRKKNYSGLKLKLGLCK